MDLYRSIIDSAKGGDFQRSFYTKADRLKPDFNIFQRPITGTLQLFRVIYSVGSNLDRQRWTEKMDGFFYGDSKQQASIATAEDIPGDRY